MDLCKFEVSLIYRASSRTIGATQCNHSLKKKKCIRVGAYVCACMWRSEVSSEALSTLFFLTWSLIGLERAKLAGQ